MSIRTPTFSAVVDSKCVMHFPPEERAQRHACVQQFCGQRVAVTIRLWKSIRSVQANNYYWGCVLDVIAKDQEMTAEEVHEAMVARFLPNEAKRIAFFNKMTGEELAVYTDGRRSSKLSGGPFYDYVERVRLFALEFLGIVTENPDPLYWRKKRTSKQEKAA